MTGRKNWMFADTPDGANASALVYSLVETAKANNVDVYYYLKYLLLKTPTSQTSDEELEKLCPWNPECKEALEDLHRQHQKEIFDAM
ncbi:transposase domain-containing protein [Butyrivibrio sp. XPD2006]|uniref:transposase domain-containing protein n=1 Tax=Butyrivibrio sp. XPD2006 TaxID=1280668 RepID=UPI0003B69096